MRLLVIISLVTTLAGCTWGVPVGDRGAQKTSSGVPATTPSKRGNPSSYVVFGKRYYVLDSSDGFVQRGIASWYGTKFHGRPTSSGEVYNMYEMTAAHKTLPIPVYVQVHNLDNGRTAVVRVNDRGPFVSGRIIDLSYAAAKKLGVDIPGTANVEIRVIEAGQSKPTSVVRSIPLDTGLEPDVPLYIQMGSFSDRMNANTMVDNLLAAEEDAVSIYELETDSGRFFRVRLGPLYDMDEANAVLTRLRNKGFEMARIVVQDPTE